MHIQNCTLNDVAAIQQLYQAARDLQTSRQMVVWPLFDDAFIENEIRENRQWKLIDNDTIACNWTVTFQDPEIWGSRDQSDAIYIHRLCTNPQLRGKRYLDDMVRWARQYAIQLGRPFVRLDTLGNNIRLIAHYTSAGFNFLGIHRLTDTAALPMHYQNEPNCCLFELPVQLPESQD